MFLFTKALNLLIPELIFSQYDPVTGQPDFSQSVPIESNLANTDMVKENMQQLLDMILGFFEDEARKVDNGELKEENMLLKSNDLQTDYTNTKRAIRQLPASFDRRRT